MAQWDRARGADRAAIREFVRIQALELALEEPNELPIMRLLLAVRYTEIIRLAIYETNKVGVNFKRIVWHKLGRRDVRSCAAVGQRFE
jgi:hypothetical protein